jgi:hypothetical protein
MWNKHLQEVTGELVISIKELPVPKRSGVLDNIKSRLAIDAPQPTKRMLTSHTRKWLLPQGDLQKVLIVTHPEQRVEQRVTPNHHAIAAPLQRITEAPPIMVAPNLSEKCTVCLTPISNLVPGYQKFLVAPIKTIVGLVKNKKSYLGHGSAMIIVRDMFGCRLLNKSIFTYHNAILISNYLSIFLI